MSPTQEAAVAYALKNEGGYVNDSSDPGGATQYGISLRLLRDTGIDIDGDGDVDVDDIRGMTQAKAGQIFIERFWSTVFDEMTPAAAIRVFDHAVNAGPKAAIVVLQRALRAVGVMLKEDGVAGPLTRLAAVRAPSEILFAIRCERAGFYRELVARRPDLSKFLGGWLSRAYR